ncbi:hypothetical protein MHYP_G00177700 [Metynnis hypsauchen]
MLDDLVSGEVLTINAIKFTLTPLNSAFSIDHSKGFVFTIKEFDYLTNPRRYSFNISVNDGNNTLSKPLFINIVNLNDDKPHFLNPITSFTVPEELSPCHIIANITAVVPNDPLYSGFIFYTISANNYLTIHKYTGLITIANRMDRDSAPLRDDLTITVTVMASFSTPGPPLSNSISLTVTVNDINDNPSICFADNQRREVPETEVKGALIATITCTDNDVVPSFTQFLFTELYCLGCNQLFVLKSNQIILNSSLDFEDPGNFYAGNEYSLLIIVQDGNDTNLKGDAVVYVTVSPVNEFPPIFNPVFYSYTISELLGSGTIIGSVNATDKDLPPTPLLYSMVSVGSSGGLRSIFHLDPKQGQISLLTRPDYEDTHTHTLIIRVVDGDLIRPRSATATVIINITEANDEPLCVDPIRQTCAGSNVSRLILREPFDYSSGLDTQWSYTLTALISDANLGSARIQTGTVITTTTEVTNINTVFDGEGVDPVSKRVYEYNSKSGARSWKDAIIVSEPALIQPESSTLVISDRPANAESPPRSGQSKSSAHARSDQSPASIQPHSGSDQSNVERVVRHQSFNTDT